MLTLWYLGAIFGHGQITPNSMTHPCIYLVHAWRTWRSCLTDNLDISFSIKWHCLFNLTGNWEWNWFHTCPQDTYHKSEEASTARRPHTWDIQLLIQRDISLLLPFIFLFLFLSRSYNPTWDPTTCSEHDLKPYDATHRQSQGTITFWLIASSAEHSCNTTQL